MLISLSSLTFFAAILLLVILPPAATSAAAVVASLATTIVLLSIFHMIQREDGPSIPTRLSGRSSFSGY